MTATMNDTKRDRLLKVKSLLEQAGTEGEQQAAMAAARRMLNGMGMTLDQLQEIEFRGDDEPDVVQMRYDTKRKRTDWWNFHLFREVGRLTNCDVVCVDGRGYPGPDGIVRKSKRYIVYGDREDVETLKMVFEQLDGFARHAATQHWNAEKDFQEVNAKTYKNQFFHGFVDRIGKRVDEILQAEKRQIEQAKQDLNATGEDNALVHVGRQLAKKETAVASKSDAFRRKNNIRTTTTRSRACASGRAAGDNAGRRADLSPKKRLS